MTDRGLWPRRIRTRWIAIGLLLVFVRLGLPSDAVTAAGRAPGDQLWMTRFDDSGGTEWLSDLALSPDGTKVFLTGYDYPLGAGDANFATVAYDAATGNELWRQIYHGPADGADLAVSLAVSPDGSEVFVAGASEGASSTTDYLTVSYDADNGSPLWESRYDGPGHSVDGIDDIAVSPDGSTVFVTGSSQGDGLTYGDFATVAYHAQSGQQVWVRRFTTPCYCADAGTALALNPDGSTVFVTGYVSPGSSFDYYTLAYDAIDGSNRWASVQDIHHRNDRPFEIATSPDGDSVFVRGRSDGDFENAVTVAYDAATGSQRWHRGYTARHYYWGVFPQGLLVSPDGASVYVTGTFKTDVFALHSGTVAYAADTGRVLWKVTVSGEAGSGLAITPDGSTVVVTGGDNTNHFATVARDAATGTVLWAARDDAEGSGGLIAISPDASRVIVAGVVEDPPGNRDYVIVAYEL